MLDTLKARLKAKTTAAGVNLSKERITAIADRLHKKFPDLKEEDEHDKAIDDLDELISFADVAKEDDRVRTLEAKSKEPKPDPKPADPKPNDPKPADDEPAWFKTYREQTDAKLHAFETEKQQGSIKQKVNEALKDVPASYGWQKRALPQKEEEIEAFVSDVQNDYREFTKDLDNKGFNMPMPRGGGGKPSDKATPEQIKSITDKIIK